MATIRKHRDKWQVQVRRAVPFNPSVRTLPSVVSRIFRTFIMRRLRFQIAAADRVVACSCSIWPTTLFRRCVLHRR